MSAVIPIVDVEYEQPLPGNACDTRHAWARVPAEPSPQERRELKDRIRRL
ncbi:MAG TPA: quinolinate synthase NadA, partial [Ramlibacter sp.]|nr:quinolinate synthase NadA [Ramlibacter sp.]